MSKIDELINKYCPEGVEWNSVGEVCDVVTGGEAPENCIKSSVPNDKYKFPIFANGSEVYGFTDKFKINKDAVTISSIGANTGTIYFRKAFFTPIIRLKVLLPKKENLYAKYIFYFLSSITIYSKKSSVPNLNADDVKKIPIPIPPLPIQEEIVKILDSFTELEQELEQELELRKKQYEYYRNNLLTFGDDVERKTLGEVCERTKGTPITAQQMAVINKSGSPIKIFAGGKTVAYVDYGDIPDKDVLTKESIVVKSRGIIGFEYINTPFSHKNEFWSYHSNNNKIKIKYVYYYLKNKENYFNFIGEKMSKMPQLSIPDTEKFSIPIPSLSEQERIVTILDKFDALVNDISIGLPAEIEARRKQYEYYRDKLLTFKKQES